MNKKLPLAVVIISTTLLSTVALAHGRDRDGWHDHHCHHGWRPAPGYVVYAPYPPVYVRPPVVYYQPAYRPVYYPQPAYAPAPVYYAPARVHYRGDRVAGQVVGAVAGGVIGNAVGGGAFATTAAGALLGGFIGGGLAE